MTSDGSTEPPLNIPSLQIQSVLYLASPPGIDRYIRGLEGAVALVKRGGIFGDIRLALGDCSPYRALRDEDVEALRRRLAAVGVNDVIYEFFDANLGSAEGHNRLLVRSPHEFILILNPDVFCGPQLLDELMLPMGDSDVGIVEARQLPLEHPKAYDRLTGETSWASTAAALLRSKVAAEIGGFDSSSFFLYCDDVDFSWRTRLAGYRVIHQPSARIFHDKRLNSDGIIFVNEAETYYSAEAALMLAWKYSRPELADEWAQALELSPSELERRAAKAYLGRFKDGTLPSPLDKDHRVAQFIGLNFAEHRFSYHD